MSRPERCLTAEQPIKLPHPGLAFSSLCSYAHTLIPLSLFFIFRINVSLEGQFLHYIHRHQFLDSPEWESLRPNEEGKFQVCSSTGLNLHLNHSITTWILRSFHHTLKVTLTAEEDSRYISWRRRRLYLLLSKDRYIARLFSVMLGYDIAEKLYNLNNKLYIKSGMLLDIRLPSLYHVLVPSSQGSGSGSDGGGISKEHEAEQRDEGQAQKRDPAQSQSNPQGPRRASTDEPQHPRQGRYQHPWGSEPELPSGEDSTSLVLEDFGDVVGSLKEYGSERDYLR